MKPGWEVRRLSEVCQFKPAKAEARSRLKPDDLVSFVPMEDLGIDKKYLKATRNEPLSAVVGSYTYFADGDVLLAKITPCFENGKLGIAAGLKNGVGFGSSEYMVLRPSGLLDREYLYYFLARPEFRAQGAARMSGAVGHKRVSKEFVETCEIPVPPLPEQRRIVGVLDEALAGLSTAQANAEKNLRNARALFDSHLEAVFTQRGEGWVEKRLGGFARIHYGYTASASTDAVGPRFLRITDIQDDLVEWESVPYCSIEEATLPKYRLVDGDIVFARTGATTGKSYLVANPPVSVFASYLIRVQPDHSIVMPQFVNLYFQTRSYWEIIRAGLAGAAQGGFNASKLAELAIPFPLSMAEQAALVKRLGSVFSETQRLARIYEQKLAALSELKKALLHQAFAGEL